jgi:hypothetical protein
VVRFAPKLFRRLATCLAIAAAFAFVVEGALGTGHHPLAGSASHGHHQVQAHSHALISHASTGDASINAHHQIDAHHHHARGDVVAGVAADHHGSVPASADGGCSCSCMSCSFAILPRWNVAAAPLAPFLAVTSLRRRQGDGVDPDGLRRPPRPHAIS